jgi:hypothetical protein
MRCVDIRGGEIVMSVVKFPILKCRDCDATIIAQRPTDSGWDCIWMNDDKTDPANGWRCPKCVAGWNIIAEEHPEVLH